MLCCCIIVATLLGCNVFSIRVFGGTSGGLISGSKCTWLVGTRNDEILHRHVIIGSTFTAIVVFDQLQHPQVV